MYRPHLSTTLYLFTFFGLCQVVTKGSNTLGDKFQQNVAMTNHSLCTGPAKSCSNTLPRQIISCVLKSKFLWKSLSLEQNFVAATSRKKSNDTEFVQLVAGTKLCFRDKDFHKNYPVHMTRFVAVMCCRDMLLQLVALNAYWPYWEFNVQHKNNDKWKIFQ